MADDRIEIEIVLDDGSIQKGFAQIRQEGKKTERSLSRNFTRALRTDVSAQFGKLTNAVIGTRVAFASLGAAVAGGAFLKVATDAAAAQEEAVNALNVSLRTAGTFSQEASESFQELARELQAQSRFGDEVILQQTALARNYARSNEEAERLIKTSIDLAEATGISLDSAVRNLGKTLSGLTGELGEAVPQVRGLTAEQLKAGAAIDVLAERFGGSALGATRTFSGALAQLSNTFGDLLESIGDTITGSPQVIALFNALSITFNNLIKNLSGSGGAFDAFFKNLVINGAAAANALIDSFSAFAQIGPFIEFQFTQVQIAVFKGLNLILSAIQPLAGLLDRLTGNTGKSAQIIVDNFSRIAELEKSLTGIAARGVEIDKSFNLARQTVDDFTTSFQELSLQGADTTQGLANNTQTFADNLDKQTKDLIRKILELQSQGRTILQNAFAPETLEGRQTVFELVAGKGKEELQKLATEVSNFVTQNQAKIQQFNQAVEQGFARAISSGIQAFVNALIQGQNALEAFGKAFLGVLGDVAIQLGTSLLVGGLGLQALFAGNPAGAILFGGALIAVGTLLKALSGGGFQGAATPGGAAPAQDSVLSPILPDQAGAIEDSARVNVTIEGNVFDGDETGLRIADILKEQGFNNAVVS